MIDHLGDLESDFSRFHRIDDIYQLDGPRFMRLAWRIGVYEGVISMRMRAQQPVDEPLVPADRQAAVTPATSTVRESSAKSVAASAIAFPDVFDVRKAR